MKLLKNCEQIMHFKIPTQRLTMKYVLKSKKGISKAVSFKINF